MQNFYPLVEPNYYREYLNPAPLNRSSTFAHCLVAASAGFALAELAISKFFPRNQSTIDFIVCTSLIAFPVFVAHRAIAMNKYRDMSADDKINHSLNLFSLIKIAAVCYMIFTNIVKIIGPLINLLPLSKPLMKEITDLTVFLAATMSGLVIGMNIYDNKTKINFIGKDEQAYLAQFRLNASRRFN